MGMGGGAITSVFDIFRREQERPEFQYQLVTPKVYTPQNYIREASQPVTGYTPARFEFSPYAQAYLNQLQQLQPQQFQPQQFQQALSPNIASGLAALAQAYGISSPLAPTAPATDSAPTSTPAASAAAE